MLGMRRKAAMQGAWMSLRGRGVAEGGGVTCRLCMGRKAAMQGNGSTM